MDWRDNSDKATSVFSSIFLHWPGLGYELRILLFPLSQAAPKTTRLLPLSRFSSLILIADKYNLKDLVGQCGNSLAQDLSLDNAIDIIDVAFKVSDAPNLRNTCVEYVGNNLGTLMKTARWRNVITPNSEILEAVLQKKC